MFVQAKTSADVALVQVISRECKTVFFLWPPWVIIEHLDGKPGFLLFSWSLSDHRSKIPNTVPVVNFIPAAF